MTASVPEIGKAVKLDNTVGALYECRLYDLYKEHCEVTEPVPSSSSGPKTSSAAKVKAEKPDSILKYLTDLGFTKEKLSEDQKHICIVVECCRCSSLFSNARFLLPHSEVCSSEQSLPCRTEAIVTDVEKRSDASAEFMCPIIEDSFQNNLKPLRTASGGGEDAVAGSSGSAAEPGPNDLFAHQMIHKSDKLYVCQICNKEFSHSSSFKRHKHTYSVEKPYFCDMCNRAFVDRSELTKHKRTHSGEKPYACEACNRRFALSCDLARHKRTHSGEKRYICDICNRRFAQSYDMIRHKRIHSGEKPYICEVCQRGFSRSDALIKHRRIHA